MEHEENKPHPKRGWRKHIVLFSIIFVVAAAGTIGYILYKQSSPLTTIDFGGQLMSFRADLREAQFVPVIPNEQTVYDHITILPVSERDGHIIYRAPLTNMTIAFKPVAEETMGWYSVEAAEIVNKLIALYKGKFGVDLNFKVISVDDYSTLQGSNTNPVIALVHPDIANGERSVKIDVDKEVVTISGGNSLRDFDLATVRFISVALGLEVPLI